MNLQTPAAAVGTPVDGEHLIGHIVAQIRDGDPDACGALYSLTSRGVRSMLRHHLGHDDHKGALQDVYLAVFQGIRRGLVRDPTRFGAFLRDAVRDRIARQTATSHPPLKMPRQDQTMRQVLSQLSPGERELLERYLVRKQSARQICREMDVTEQEFRTAIIRAKRLFAARQRPHAQSAALAAAAQGA